MRLIDADRLYNVFKEIKSENKIGYTEEQEKLINQDIDLMMGLIYEQPIAYDVDKVVEQLKCDTCSTCTHEEYCNANYHEDFWERLREFVKAGGIDEKH